MIKHHSDREQTLMQAIPGDIKALVILISNEMPFESTDQSTTASIQADVLQCNIQLTPEQGIHEFATGFKVSPK